MITSDDFCPWCNTKIDDEDETCHEMNEGRHYHLNCWHETGRAAWKVVNGVVYTVQGGQEDPMPFIGE